MTRQVLANAQPGSIVLFHANGRGWHTDGALPGSSPHSRQGYEFVTVSLLARRAGDDGDLRSRPGDRDHHPRSRWQPALKGSPAHVAGAGFLALAGWRRDVRPDDGRRPQPVTGVGLAAAASIASNIRRKARKH